MMFSALVLGLIFSFVGGKSFASPPNPDWRGGRCAQFDEGGNFAGWISNSVCRNIRGSIKKWNKTACVEVTPAKALIREFPNKNICRCVVGTVYAMSGDFCGEFTPEGTKLRWLADAKLCETDLGILKLRCN
jgi:hypothetical protein